MEPIMRMYYGFCERILTQDAYIHCICMHSLRKVLDFEFDIKRAETGPIILSEESKRDRVTHQSPRVMKQPGFVASYVGECVGFDTIVRISAGKCVYLHVCIDLYAGVALAYANTSASSAASAQSAMQRTLGGRIKHILTDNGSECAKHFRTEAEKGGVTHWHAKKTSDECTLASDAIEHCGESAGRVRKSYPPPKGVNNLQAFNPPPRPVDWILWYNFKRPHHTLGQRSPVQYLQNTKKSKNGWDHTCLNGIMESLILLTLFIKNKTGNKNHECK